MRCYLVRHGDAVSSNIDPRRPLSGPGREAVVALARLSARRQVEIAEICHSGILRAQQTAEILGAHLVPRRGVRSIAGLLPDDDPQVGKSEIETAQEPIMLVGHLPYMKRLAALLVGADGAGSEIEFSPATMICCSRSRARWRFAWRIQPPFR